jgi:hypothetical protein
LDPKPSVSNILHFSWSKTKELLLPFEFKRWIKIFVIVMLAGSGGGNFNGGNFNPPGQTPETQEEVTQAPATQSTAQSPLQDQLSQLPPQGHALDDVQGIPQQAAQARSGQDTIVPQGLDEGNQSPFNLDQVPMPLLVFVIVLLIFLGILWMWLSSRFNFILLDFMKTRELSIRKSFSERRTLGNSYFKWSLGFLALTIGIGFLLMIPIVIGPALLIVSIPLVTVLGVVAAVIGTCVPDFVLPIMYQDQRLCMDSCKRFLSLKPGIGPIALYLLLKIGLGIAAAIVSMIVALLIFLAILIVGLMIGLLGNGLIAMIPALKGLLTVLGVIFLILGTLCALIAIGVATLPIPIFFRALSITYLVRLLPDYNLFGFSSPGTEA